MAEPIPWALVVHGGAKAIEAAQEEANRVGCLEALAAGRSVLEQGGSAVAAVEAAIRVLEADPTFNAGTGAVTNDEGECELDAALMDGQTLAIGAVAGLRGVPHPISVARRMLPEDEILLIAQGAARFAAEHGFPVAAKGAPETPGPDSRHDTVGCVALDTQGHLAAGTSTGGLSGQRAGRVGDSPLPGCGFYADDQQGAAALSGDGEQIARVLLASQALRLAAQAGPDQGVEAALSSMRERVGSEAGIILLSPVGEIGWGHTSRDFACAWQTSGTPAVVQLQKSRGNDV
ncbi:isoaspartyl peptidase/L-asparaginase family protein (plasmid) [Deinococcus sp. KNUC1210]|uniref:isoaspartyl peptidase/L-asparaginase family protein n=1 Tax=Deinococcus sp. KNUC1210 TaxID=2917691 RepID=UPI001EF07B83|nr:isoaspartyl peptidase/L-asparaginase family protein [Deinococcus sp. KNUC1210]ULH17650.1 isoaspartyl peptidase/L-asparaginase family protein [Deinococcus sp. KNUC1210]